MSVRLSICLSVLSINSGSNMQQDCRLLAIDQTCHLSQPGCRQQILINSCWHHAFDALMLLVGRQEGHLAYKKTDWWGAGVVICLERGADLHMAQLMPLPLTVSCFSKIHTGFTFLVPAHLGSPGQRAVKRVCV